jgi:hypothetical protein
MSPTPTGLNQTAAIRERPLPLLDRSILTIIRVISRGFKWSLGEFNPFRVEPVYDASPG